MHAHDNDQTCSMLMLSHNQISNRYNGICSNSRWYRHYLHVVILVIVGHLIFDFDFSFTRSTEVLFLHNFLCACAVSVFHDCSFDEMWVCVSAVSRLSADWITLPTNHHIVLNAAFKINHLAFTFAFEFKSMCSTNISPFGNDRKHCRGIVNRIALNWWRRAVTHTIL